MKALGSPIAFDYGFLRFEDGLRGVALSDGLAEGAVTAPGAEAGCDEVAETAEAVECCGATAKGCANFNEFVEGTC